MMIGPNGDVAVVDVASVVVVLKAVTDKRQFFQY
jgi:hypothetical protein